MIAIKDRNHLTARVGEGVVIVSTIWSKYSL